MRQYILSCPKGFVKGFLSYFSQNFDIFFVQNDRQKFNDRFLKIKFGIRPFSLDECCKYGYNDIVISSISHFGA